MRLVQLSLQRDIQEIKQCQLVRWPQFMSYMEKGIMDDGFIEQIFPKVTSLELDTLGIPEEKEEVHKHTMKTIIKHCKMLTNLDVLQGDIVLIMEFLE